jgi:DNA-binding NtrC family response regulator
VQKGESQQRAEKCPVLVVEDDVASRNALRMLLRYSGFNGLYAGTVAEALAHLPARPCCVILDLMLPDGNGSSVLEHIRSSNLPAKVAIATGASDWEQMIDVPRLKPDVVFRKPLEFDRLVEWLQECTGQLPN